MPSLVHRSPRYRKHRASGQAVVWLGGRDRYLGTYGSAESRREYDRLVAEYLVAGRQTPPSLTTADDAGAFTIAELIVAFRRHARTYYRAPDGLRISREAANYDEALAPLRRLYGRTPVASFGPLELKAVRGEMMREKVVTDAATGITTTRPGLCRNVVNRRTGRIKHVFRWGVENALVPPHVTQGICAVSGLRKGRSDARESDPVKSVPDAHVDAALAYVTPHVRAMIELQRLTGARPGEICCMRGIDLDTTGRLWLYKPSAHKGAHLDHLRVIYLGPRAQDVVRPFLKTDLEAFLFKPAESEARRRAAAHEARKTPLSVGNVPGSNIKRQRARPFRDYFTVTGYRRSIARACEKAGVPSWHPHQLRHSAGTSIRKQFGVEAAQVVLGHRTLKMTELYAETNIERARSVMLEVG